FRIESLAERHDISGRIHGDADAEHLLMIETHDLRLWVRIAAVNDGNVTEADGAAVHGDQRVGELIQVLELAARPDIHAIIGGGEYARGSDRILRPDRLGDPL